MGVIERAIEIHYATFPRAKPDGLAHPFGAAEHEPYRWRVSRDVWAALMDVRGPGLARTEEPLAADRLLGEHIIIDAALPPSSMVLEPIVAKMVANVDTPSTT